MSDTQTAPQATAGTALSPMQYLDRAMGALRDMGLMPGSTAEATHLPGDPGDRGLVAKRALQDRWNCPGDRG